MEPEILFEDESIIVCRKPAGIATQTPVTGQQDMVSILRSKRGQRGEDTYIGIVHRLDQPVEGIMVFAKTKEAAGKLSRQVREREFGKEYLAVVEGKPEPEKGTLVHYLIRDGRTNISRAVPKGERDGKRAELDYEVLGTLEGESLVKIHLKTGRHHQIRVQMAESGTPIAGDKKYNKNADAALYLPLMLCSRCLEFIHPINGKTMKFAIEPEGKVFKNFLSLLG